MFLLFLHPDVYFSAEELEYFHLFCASLFAVPTTGGSAEPQIAANEMCLTIKVMDEVRHDGLKRKLESQQLIFPSHALHSFC